MAVVARGFCKYIRNVLDPTLRKNNIHLGVVNPCYSSESKNENEPDYKYELSFNLDEWKYVEKLIPLKIVPHISKKAEYPSGWRPQSEEAMEHPYYIKRSKNHMLPVYLDIANRGQLKTTVVKHIYGDIWKLHEELHQHLEETLNKKILSYVMEGNCLIKIKGDYVYYCEQFLLSKGF